MKLPDSQQQQRIENIIHSRFFDRTNIYNVYKWLENFSDEEMNDAIDVMEHIMYFRESDLINMLEKVFKSLFGGIDIDKSLIYIMPLGEPGKSGDAMMYCAHKVLHNKILKAKDSFRFINYAEEVDIQLCENKDNAYVVLLDDIIGSGGSFSDYIKNNTGKPKTDLLPIINNGHIGMKLIAPVILESGKNRIAKEYPSIEILCKETYNKAFEKGKSVFGWYKPLLRLRQFCYKYGKLLEPKNPLGWNNSQALVVFDHATPNNTLPIVWSNKYVKSMKRNWFPLFPRSYNLVGSRAYSDRTENNRWVSMLVGALFKDKLSAMNFEERHQILKKYFTKDNYNIVLLLRMMMSKEPNFRIANALAITSDDLDALYEAGVGFYWDENHRIKDDVRTAYEEVEKQISFERTRASWKHPKYSDDRHYMYTPETFRGLT